MKKRKGSKKGKAAKRAAKAQGPEKSTPQFGGNFTQITEVIPSAGTDLFSSQGNLEASRTHWQYGAWEELAKLSPDLIDRDPERAKLSVLVAVAHSHLDSMPAARLHARRAIDWGCDRKIAARVLISAVENSLGKASAALGDKDEAEEHFKKALGLVETRADSRLLAQTRQVREYARMGLLTDAHATLATELTSLAGNPDDTAARLKMMQTEMELLKGELMLALRRGQIGVSQDASRSNIGRVENLESKAVSQLGQDLWVLEKTGYKRSGFFVEFGATNGVLLSNTWLLEKEFGWRGICAEPNPKFYAELIQNRDCMVSDACIGAKTGETVEFILADVFGVIASYAGADLHKERRAAYKQAGEVLFLTTTSLDDFLKQHNAPREIDYLSIDTEGNEYDILAAFPFKEWTIRYITVEHNHTPLRDKIKVLLESYGYIRKEAQFDDWYELTS